MGLLSSLTAAFRPPTVRPATSVSVSSQNQSRLSIPGAQEEWAKAAMDFFDCVPELRYGISWIASSASRASLICARVPEHPAASPIPIDEDSSHAAPLQELAPTTPDQSVFISHAITLAKLVGQWYLVGFDDPYLSGRRRWIVISAREYKTIGSKISIRHPDTGTELQMPILSNSLPESQRSSAAWVIRMWNRHPVWSHLPDSPVRSLIPTLQELVDLSGHVQTAAKSRLAGAGLLLMPSSLKPVAPGQSTGVNPPDGNPAMRALVRTAQASLQSPTDVSRHLPVIFEGNQEALNAVRHLPLNTPFDERVDELRTAAVRRIAIGLDIPPEVLTGMGGLNHWTAWQVDAAGQRINVAPALSQLCRELTTKYYWPSLRAMGVSDPQKYMIWYDDTSLENTPNRAEIALQAYQSGLISDTAARETLGYGAADAPDPDDSAPPPPPPPSTPTEGIKPRSVNNLGPASGKESQVIVPPASANNDGWIACADVAARRALGRIGQHLLASGGRNLRGKYRNVPLHNMHTHIHPANEEIRSRSLSGAFTELSEVAPRLVEPVKQYAIDRMRNGKPHDRSVLIKFLEEVYQCQ